MNPQNFQDSHTSPSHTLNCRMAFESAALERLCQVVRIRGFRVARMVAEVTLPLEPAGFGGRAALASA